MTLQDNVTYENFTINRDCGINNISGIRTCEQYLCLRANLPNTVRENETQCICQVNFITEDDMDTPVYMYYSLHNYFQNHRRYAYTVYVQSCIWWAYPISIAMYYTWS